MNRPTSSETNGRDARVERLRASRAKDSEVKTARALDAVQDLLRRGPRITVACVARDAAVSTWFVYNQPEVHQAVQDGIAAQRAQGYRRCAVSETQQASVAGLRTDLALAREEIKDLKTERDRLRNRVRLSLGAELDEADRNSLISECSNWSGGTPLWFRSCQRPGCRSSPLRAGCVKRKTISPPHEPGSAVRCGPFHPRTGSERGIVDE